MGLKIENFTDDHFTKINKCCRSLLRRYTSHSDLDGPMFPGRRVNFRVILGTIVKWRTGDERGPNAKIDQPHTNREARRALCHTAFAYRRSRGF
jgi:hypothetical protein